MPEKHRSGAPRASSRTGAAPALARSRHLLVWLGLAAALLSVMGVAWLTSRPAGESTSPGVATVAPPTEPATFVGSAACASCHAEQHAAWTKSQHARAMQHASADTVRGDFNDAKYSRDGVTSTFLTRDGRFYVRTDGPDGKLADFEIKYTFGVEPLQQYLVELPGGRLQALSVTWDTRPEREGGQRWFRQYPDEKLDFRDELHWTQRSQNWNFMCADCHSTQVVKGYDANKNAFDTRSNEISVGCEACHGPGSTHIAWAKEKAPDPRKGLTAQLDERRGVTWSIDAATGNAKRSRERTGEHEIEVCAQCHARRAQVAEGYHAGKPFLDHYLPSLLVAPLYWPDGQQRDEVFIWGSWLQSRMHRQGVTCSDCHDPHTQKLRVDGNAVCGQCHAPGKFDTPAHHHHAAGSAGGQCAECHMPQTTYMVVDPRRDHSLRVPRPDQSVAFGVPNACTNCHTDRDAQWAASAIRAWLGRDADGFQRFTSTFHAAEAGRAVSASLAAVANDLSQPAIARASAIERMARAGSADAANAQRAARDANPLVRLASVLLAEALPPEQRLALLAPLLSDPLRSIRIEAARATAGQQDGLNTAQLVAWEKAARHYVDTLRYNADRPEARVALGTFYARIGRDEEAQAAFASALTLDAAFVPAYLNGADAWRLRGRDDDAIQTLQQGLAQVPDNAALRHTLGLALVRQERPKEALRELQRAAELAPDEPRYTYVHAVALNSTGRPAEALRVLEKAVGRWPDQRDLLFALATMQRDAGRIDAARRTADRLARAHPGDPEVAALVQQLL